MLRENAYRTLAMLVVVIVAGCQSSGPPLNSTRLDRLMVAYPALETGKFSIVADFEDETHMELVTLRATTPTAKFAYDRSHGRRHTGPACLKVTATSAEDTVFISNRTSSTWYLQSDWRAFDTMMVSVHAPRAGLAANVMIRSGADHKRATAPTSHPLDEGWNVIRVDIAEIAEHIAIDRIQDIELSFPGVTKKTDLYIDDLLLTTDRSMVFGDITRTPYVQRIGERIHIGTPNQYELTFAQGQIVNWFDLSQDPHRLHNLTRGTTLGPRPVVLDAALRRTSEFTALGSAIVSEQRLLEASAVRTVVECVWRFVSNPKQTEPDSPTHRRRYTIYPTGHVYVLVEADVSNESWQPTQVGLSIRMAPPANDRVTAGLPTDSDGTPLPYGHLGSESQASRLLVAINATGSPHLVTHVEAETGIRSLVLVDGQETASRTWRCLLWLTSSEETFEAQAVSQASFFLQAPPLNLEVARTDQAATDAVVRQAEFDRTTGSYILQPKDGRVSLTLRPGSPATAQLAFTVSESAGREAWVYVDDVLHEPVARNTDGNLIFQLRGTLHRTARVEVILRHSVTEAGS